MKENAVSWLRHLSPNHTMYSCQWSLSKLYRVIFSQSCCNSNTLFVLQLILASRDLKYSVMFPLFTRLASLGAQTFINTVVILNCFPHSCLSCWMCRVVLRTTLGFYQYICSSSCPSESRLQVLIVILETTSFGFVQCRMCKALNGMTVHWLPH